MAIPSEDRFEITPANPEHYDDLLTLVNRSWKEGYSKFLKDPFSRYSSVEAVAEDAKKNKIFVLYDKLAHKIVGSIQFNTNYKDGTYGGGLCIHPEYQRDNLAVKLVEFVETESLKAGKPKLYGLVIKCAKPLRAYYNKMGFEETGATMSALPGFEECLRPAYKDTGSLLELRKNLVRAKL